MHSKRLISMIMAAAVSCTLLFGSTANAAASESEAAQKAAVMAAAGEGSASASVTAQAPASPAIPSEASVKIKKDEAVSIARTMLDDQAGFAMSSANLNPAWGSSSATWNINFNDKNNSNTASVTLDADTGKITGYNIWTNYYEQKNYIATLTRSEAAVKAEAFLKDKMKYDIASYELQKEDPNAYGYKTSGVKSPVNYSFNYTRKIDGVYLPNDNIYVSVDGTDGRIVNFSCYSVKVDLGKLPKKDNAITAEAALGKYKENIDLALEYINIYPANPYTSPVPKTMLVYAPMMSTDMINAVSGKSVGYDGKEITQGVSLVDQYTKPKLLDPSAVLPKAVAISDADCSKKAENYKTIIESYIGTKFDQNIEPGSIYYGAASDSWSYSLYKNIDNTSYNFSITINKKTGLLNGLNFGRYTYIYQAPGSKTPAKVINPKVNWKQAKEKAEEALKKLLPNQYGFFADVNNTEPELTPELNKTLESYSFNFMRVINGIVYRDNNINISIDRETGGVQGFYFNWNDVELPKPENIIESKAAIDTYMQGMNARLSYFQKNIYDSKTGIQKFDEVPMLVYNFLREGNIYSSYVDAVTGKVVDYSGNEVKKAADPGSPKSKDGWADRSIDLLIAQGIIKSPLPDFESVLTRGDAVRMLSIARGSTAYYDPARVTAKSFDDVGSDSEYYYYVENAVREGIIAKGGKLNLGEKITKAEFVKMLANTLGYGDIAKKQEIFKLDPGISNPGDVGSTAICSALGLLPVKTGAAYDGNNSITYAEAAVALYKALNYIR